MTNLSWDHTVHYVNDPCKAVAAFHKNGLAAFQGGSHIEWGTYNALSYFGLTYIEFLGVENRELVAKTEPYHYVVKESVSYLPEREAFSRVAIRTDDIEGTAADLKQQGMKLSPIMDGKRVTDNGELVEWRMMTIEGDFHGLLYPFVIQWKDMDAERLERLTKSGTIQPHPAGKTTIGAAVFFVSDPARVAQHWGKVFGLEVMERDEDSVSLQIGRKDRQKFIFKRGEANELKQLVFQTEAPTLKGKTITIGEAEYVFKEA